MANVKFHYLYRDGSNFKKWSQVVFRNPEGLRAGEIASSLRKSFASEDLFIADQIQIPGVFLYEGGDADADDHCYHEFDFVEITDEPPSDAYDRSISQFIAQVQSTRWQAFDPFDRSPLQGVGNTRVPPRNDTHP